MPIWGTSWSVGGGEGGRGLFWLLAALGASQCILPGHTRHLLTGSRLVIPVREETPVGFALNELGKKLDFSLPRPPPQFVRKKARYFTQHGPSAEQTAVLTVGIRCAGGNWNPWHRRGG